jgi:hypothetical protein
LLGTVATQPNEAYAKARGRAMRGTASGASKALKPINFAESLHDFGVKEALSLN